MTAGRSSKGRGPGKVYLVGAGPGHPELLTLKAAELLKAADVVVYDRLIQEEVLALAKPSAERIYMGKPVGRHDSRQAEVNELLLRKARERKMVVRLKGGDPFLFGRGGEEAEYLAAHAIPFDVIPGVSSALAAPLSAGIAVTHRELSSAVAFVTGHEASKAESGMDWAALSRVETLVFLMGVNNVGVIAEKLVEHGRDPGTPAAMIQMAYWHGERVVTGTLATIAGEVRKAEIRPPATLVVGKVVRLREKLKHAQRDLRRRPDGDARFQPAPAPDQLLRLACAGLGSQVLRFALAAGLFDLLEVAVSERELARTLGLNTVALKEILDSLVALGVLEGSPAGYRNLDLASRYLRSDSPQSLKPALLYLAAQSTRWEDLAQYALDGSRDLVPDGNEEYHRSACESLARFAAPAVVEKLELAECAPVLLVGWGGDAYRDALARRWPEIDFTARNPFAGESLPDGNHYGAILLSGLLASSGRGEVQRMLRAAEAGLRRGGVLALHDMFLPVGALPPPEVALGSLGRRITRGGCRTWSVGRLRQGLEALGLRNVRSEALPAGTVLVIAHKG